MWPFKKSKTIELNQQQLIEFKALSDLFLPTTTVPSAATTSGAMALYRTSSAVSIPVDYIADLIAQLQPVVLDLNDNDNQIDSPVIEFLKKPSPYHTKNQILKYLAVDYLVTSNAFLISHGNINATPAQILPINSTNAVVIGVDYPEYIQITNGAGEGNYLSDIKNNDLRFIKNSIAECSHLRGFSTRDNGLLTGESLLLSLQQESEQSVRGGKHINSMLKTGGNVKTVFHFEDSIPSDKFNELKSRVRAEYGGENSESIAVTSGRNLKITPIGSSNKEQEFSIVQQTAKLTIAQRYKIPLPLITNEAATFNNYAQARLALYDDAVLPVADSIFNFLQTLLFRRFKIDSNRYRLTYDINEIIALETRRQSNLGFRKDLAVETINELRSGLGREEISGGNLLYQPMGLVPVGSDRNTDDNIKSNKKKVKYQLKKFRYFALEHKKQHDLAEQHQIDFEKALEKQQKALFNNFSTSKTEIEKIINDNSDDLIEAIEDLYIKGGIDGGLNVVVNTKDFEDDLRTAIEKVLDTEKTILTEKSLLNDSTVDSIINAIRRGEDEGLTITEIQSMVISTGTFSSERALRISRTVAGTAQSIGQIEGAKTADAQFKKWIDSGFEVRPQHVKRNGEEVGIDERFSSQFGGSRPRYPLDQQASVADRVNCRCAMIFRQ